MKIYVGHSSSFPYEEELYEPLRNSDLNEEHQMVLPHGDSEELFDSKSFLRDEADLFIAEVSRPSTGLGIELGWANQFGVPIVCFYKKISDPSSSLKAITEEIQGYESPEELVELLEKEVKEISEG